jgi:hypothetical protein
MLWVEVSVFRSLSPSISKWMLFSIFTYLRWRPVDFSHISQKRADFPHNQLLILHTMLK